VSSSDSSFSFHYLLIPVRSTSSCLHLFPRLYFSFTFPLITCFRRQFLRNIWFIQLAFRIYCSSTVLSSLTLCDTFSFFTCSVPVIFSVILQYHISELSKSFRSTFPNVQFSVLWKSVLEAFHYAALTDWSL
jgi:hypothetical protein